MTPTSFFRLLIPRYNLKNAQINSTLSRCLYIAFVQKQLAIKKIPEPQLKRKGDMLQTFLLGTAKSNQILEKLS